MNISRRIRAGHVARTGAKGYVYTILVGKAATDRPIRQRKFNAYLPDERTLCLFNGPSGICVTYLPDGGNVSSYRNIFVNHGTRRLKLSDIYVSLSHSCVLNDPCDRITSTAVSLVCVPNLGCWEQAGPRSALVCWEGRDGRIICFHLQTSFVITPGRRGEGKFCGRPWV